MAIINDVKLLVTRSKLFMAEDKINKGKATKKSWRGKSDIKIGQGGTLDPLADGVLGDQSMHQPGVLNLTLKYSGRCGQSHKKTVPISGLRKGNSIYGFNTHTNASSTRNTAQPVCLDAKPIPTTAMGRESGLHRGGT